MTTGPGPLAGLRILDLTALAPGPFATMLLGDLGADVVTVEPPTGARSASKLSDLPGYGGAAARAAGLGLFRSRRSIVVDLTNPDGGEVLLRLAERSDVLFEGFRPGTCDRLGVGYAAVSARSPGVIYCSISGYGQRGELAQRAGHDLNYLAESGMLSTTTRPGQRPAIPLNVVADFAAGGLVAAFGVLAALHARQRSGRGTHVDVSMYESLLGLLQVSAAWTSAGAPDPSWGAGLLTGAVPFYDCYQTSDGRWLSVAALEPKFFTALCEALGHPEMAGWQHRPETYDEMRARFEASFAEASLVQWQARLGEVDTAVAPVRSIPEAFEEARHQGLVDGRNVVGPLPRMSQWRTEAGAVTRHPGEHTREVLSEAGYPDEEIERLLSTGAIAE